VKRLLVLLCLVPVLGGCSGKNPVKVAPPVPPPPVGSPQNVLNNLIKSYSYRDSAQYMACFDTAYVGQSYDGFDVPGIQPATYTFADEAAHISKLTRSATIPHVTLDLPNYQGAPMDTLAGDPAGWVTINIHNPRVEIDEFSGSIGIVTGETFEFKLAPTTVSSSVSPTGKLWRIARWTEISP
jgi:hypothetical protein